jgi:3-phosphoshikimate 1-carboxyvinyltransferase
MHFQINPSRVRSASVTVPGDKSVSHRALMLGSIAEGRTDVSGFLAGEDCLATLAAMRALGVDIRQTSTTEMSIGGVGLRGLRGAASDLDLGNSGTAMRLMAGLLVGQRFDSVLIGDASLTARPMRRIIEPLSSMGAKIESRDGKPPLVIRGQDTLRAIEYVLPMASAQVKSALLLAGLYADGTTQVTEPAVTRDHTERMLRSMGAAVVTKAGTVSIAGGQRLHGCEVRVPADLSSAAFVMLAAVLADNADILIKNVGVNPTRTGVIDILRGMGADIRVEHSRSLGEEPVADIRVRSSKLHGGIVDPALVSLAIDEFPVLFVAAAAAQGKTEFSGLAELRVKESDRIATMAKGMRKLGITVDETPEGAIVLGGRFGGGVVQSGGDHRVAMSLALAGTIASDSVLVEDVAAVDTSFPGFPELMTELGVDISRREGN